MCVGERHGGSRGAAGPLPRRRAGRHRLRRRRCRAAALPHGAEVRAGEVGGGEGPAACGPRRRGGLRGGLALLRERPGRAVERAGRAAAGELPASGW